MSGDNQRPWVEYDGTQPVAKLGGMHLWSIQANAENAACQSDAEMLRSANIKDAGVRQDYAISQGGLRRILAAYGDGNPRELPILRATHGKPYLKNGPQFNLSHTRNQTFVIISRHEVGLDVEASDRRVRAVELGKKFFTADEQALLSGSEEEIQTLFLRMWVCKEAMVKLSGDGIYHGLRDAHVVVNENGFTKGNYRDRSVYLRELRPAPGFLAAVASWENGQVNSFFRL